MGRFFAAALAGLLLAGCGSFGGLNRQQWARFDGQDVHSSSALEQQGEVDFATCKAVAVNAGNGAPMPVPAARNQNNVAVNVYGGSGAPAPGSYQAPQVDFSGLGDIGDTIVANRRRSQTEQATMEACMAQRGYRLVSAK
jgi:hypothetical protein